MVSGVKVWTRRVAAIPLCVLIFTSSPLASETPVDQTPKTEAATSLKRILEKAGEKGLLKLDEGASNDPEKSIQNDIVDQQFDCHPSEVLDLWTYTEVVSFDDASKAKSELTSYESVQDVIPVAQTFLSLGLGTEAVASLRSFSVREAKLLSALGRIIDGTSSDADVQTVQSYKSCGSMTQFWALVAQSAPSFEPTLDPNWGFSVDETQMLLELPKHLSMALTTMVGIHAAESGQQLLAESLYAILEPQYRYGADPKNKSDEVLYFFGLLKNLNGDPTAKQIFEYLAQKDGVYQVRSLLKMVQHGPEESADKEDDHLINLLSVQQQYRGKASSRRVSLEIVKQQASERQYAYAIELTKKEFDETDSEFRLAVENVGLTLQSELSLKDKARQITALNGYLYDTNFFSLYSELALLQYLAHKAAVDLNLPEIAQNISQTALSLTENAAALTKDILLADIKMLFNKGRYTDVLQSGLAHLDDPRFRSLLMKASLKGGNREFAAKIAQSLGSNAAKLAFEADFASVNGDWKNAETALQSLENLKSDDFDQSENLAIVEYVANGNEKNNKRPRVNSIKAAETLSEGLNADIGLVKEFLTNG